MRHEGGSRDPYRDGYPRECSRCGAAIHVPDPPHECKDLRERGARQERTIAVIEAILIDAPASTSARDVAEAIYKALRDGIADLP